MRKDRMAQPAAPLAVTGILYLVLLTLFSGSAFSETPFAMGDPASKNLAGFPVAWGTEGSGQEGLKGRFPFQPLDRDPTEGIRHGFVQTGSGRFGFEVIDLRLPGRVPLNVGRVSLPGTKSSPEPSHRIYRKNGTPPVPSFSA